MRFCYVTLTPPNTLFQKRRCNFEALLVPGRTLKIDIIYKKTLGFLGQKNYVALSILGFEE